MYKTMAASLAAPEVNLIIYTSSRTTLSIIWSRVFCSPDECETSSDLSVSVGGVFLLYKVLRGTSGSYAAPLCSPAFL